MDEVKEIIGEARFEALAKNTEATLLVFANDLDVVLDDEAVNDVLDYICNFIVQSDTPIEFAEAIIDEMSEPRSTQARTNISMAVGGKGDENESLYRLRSKAVAQNYEQV